MFTGHIDLRQRSAFPRMAELPFFIRRVCREMSFPYVGEMEMEKDFGKLRTSDDHLNDHVLHVNYKMLYVFSEDLCFMLISSASTS